MIRVWAAESRWPSVRMVGSERNILLCQQFEASAYGIRAMLRQRRSCSPLRTSLGTFVPGEGRALRIERARKNQQTD